MGIDWRDVHVGFEGDGLKIAGIAVWSNEWRRVYENAIQLPHPSYPTQLHRYDVYEIGAEETPVQLAAGELSNGVWGFYVPT
jgi:hypothetical protein